ncbi:Vacuolar-sorting protein SNF7 [Tolypocladium capitatum]|uniref:Vacuolar-sorting protein SNF7 n=1 Tax=Tolypocladium capitatum TaxID=45235 RepID=A0A2K3Q2D4_9HYPO|nr:Vacuolar-sorting protein SNF7 [Tolypocladium capitatum]
MWSWFGGAAAQSRKESPKDAILLMRSQLDMLQKRERHLRNQIDEQLVIARNNANSNKNDEAPARDADRTAVAKAALRRKKTHEQTLDQTMAQIGTMEQQINAIESANINRETLVAMQKAGDAMKRIHGKLTLEKVDQTMCVPVIPLRLSRDPFVLTGLFRETLRDQNALSQEIVEAITGATIGEQVDDADLEDELDQIQQEQLDEEILKTGTVPVSDAVHKMPSPANAERESWLPQLAMTGPDRHSAVSSKKPMVEEDDEEAELRKLQAEMAM